jgi:hypothetical protein
VIGAVQSKNVPVEPEPSRRFNLLFTVEGSGIQGTLKCVHKKKFIGYKLIFDSTFFWGGGDTVWVIIYLFSNTKVGGAGICLAQKQSLGTKALMPFLLF